MSTMDPISSFSTGASLRHVFKMSAFGTCACFDSWMCVVQWCANVYLHNWKEWV